MAITRVGMVKHEAIGLTTGAGHARASKGWLLYTKEDLVAAQKCEEPVKIVYSMRHASMDEMGRFAARVKKDALELAGATIETEICEAELVVTVTGKRQGAKGVAIVGNPDTPESAWAEALSRAKERGATYVSRRMMVSCVCEKTMEVLRGFTGHTLIVCGTMPMRVKEVLVSVQKRGVHVVETDYLEYV